MEEEDFLTTVQVMKSVKRKLLFIANCYRRSGIKQITLMIEQEYETLVRAKLLMPPAETSDSDIQTISD